MIPWLVCMGKGAAAGLLVYSGWLILDYLWAQDGRPPLWTPRFKGPLPEEPGTVEVAGPSFPTTVLVMVVGFLLGLIAKPLPPPLPPDPVCERYKAEAAFYDKIQAESHLTPLQRAQAAHGRSTELPWKKGGLE